MATVELKQDSFMPAIEAEGITVIDFWAPWCGPCRAFAPVFEAASERYDDITFAKVNTQDEPELGAALQVKAIPTLMIFRDGVLVFRQPGMVPEDALHDVVGKVQELDMAEVHRKIAEHEAQQAT